MKGRSVFYIAVEILICAIILSSKCSTSQINSKPSLFEHVFGFANTVDSLVSLSNNVTYKQFERFANKLNKSYDNEVEFEYRFKIFKHNIVDIIESRLNFLTGKISYILGINEFTDQTEDEIQNKLRAFTSSESVIKSTNLKSNSSVIKLIRDDFDETLDNLINEDKDRVIIDWREISQCVGDAGWQNGCGSCYAFSAISVFESMLCLQNNQTVNKGLQRLSVQQVIDCFRDYLDFGCNGGFPQQVFEYYIKEKSIISDTCYPYTGKEDICLESKLINTQDCNVKLLSDNQSLNIVELFDERSMLAHLIKHGPFAAIIAVDKTMKPRFVSYESGVYEYNTETDIRRNHAVVIVGAGRLNGLKYWIIKNSWGKTWGIDGFALIRRGKNSMKIEKSNYGLIYSNKSKN